MRGSQWAAMREGMRTGEIAAVAVAAPPPARRRRLLLAAGVVVVTALSVVGAWMIGHRAPAPFEVAQRAKPAPWCSTFIAAPVPAPSARALAA